MLTSEQFRTHLLIHHAKLYELQLRIDHYQTQIDDIEVVIGPMFGVDDLSGSDLDALNSLYPRYSELVDRRDELVAVLVKFCLVIQVTVPSKKLSKLEEITQWLHQRKAGEFTSERKLADEYVAAGGKISVGYIGKAIRSDPALREWADSKVRSVGAAKYGDMSSIKAEKEPDPLEAAEWQELALLAEMDQDRLTKKQKKRYEVLVRDLTGL